MALEAFLGGFLEPKMVLNLRKHKIEKPYETLRVRIEFEGRLVRKPWKKTIKNDKKTHVFSDVDFGLDLDRFYIPK